MLSKKQTQRGEEIRARRKSAKSGRRPHQPLSNDESCNTNKCWSMLQNFVHQANKEDMKWLDNLVKDIESEDGNVEVKLQKLSNKYKDEEINITRQMLKLELIQNHGKQVIPPKDHGKQVIPPKDHGKQVILPKDLTQTNKISYEFIARLIKSDDCFSHLRGITPKHINCYLLKCREDNSLENMKIQMEKMDSKILNNTKRGNYSLKKERKTAQKYKECEDICLILEKYNTYILEQQNLLSIYH